MLRITGLKIKIPHTPEALKALIQKKARGQTPLAYHIIRRSVDARKKPDLYYVYTLDVEFPHERKLLHLHNSPWSKSEEKTYRIPSFSHRPSDQKPVIIGAGPAGLFAGLVLARAGFCPVIYERGDEVERRSQKVARFFETGILDPESNVQFGEGGAGTFSDGKLNTMVKDRDGRNRFVLREFVRHGAPEEILYDAKPHIGTDILKTVVAALGEEIRTLGGELHFCARLEELIKDPSGLCLKGIRIREQGILKERACRQVILAVGHSARDTFYRLNQEGILMQPKAFAIGVRIEHPREMINEALYGRNFPETLGAASYKLTHRCRDGRGVYTFCMCPGGYVVNSSSEDHCLCINGMSNYLRDSRNSNSAVIVTVSPEDFGSGGPLAGLAFQRRYEGLAYRQAGGKIPIQLFGDYRQKIPSTRLKDLLPEMKGAYSPADVRACLPPYVGNDIEEGILAFAQKIKGYDREDALISGVETRTSSPLRILRREDGNSSLKGLYPCGEGAGYAGGITSAAMDGIRTAEILMDAWR